MDENNGAYSSETELDDILAEPASELAPEIEIAGSGKRKRTKRIPMRSRSSFRLPAA